MTKGHNQQDELRMARLMNEQRGRGRRISHHEPTEQALPHPTPTPLFAHHHDHHFAAQGEMAPVAVGGGAAHIASHDGTVAAHPSHLFYDWPERVEVTRGGLLNAHAIINRSRHDHDDAMSCGYNDAGNFHHTIPLVVEVDAKSSAIGSGQMMNAPFAARSQLPQAEEPHYYSRRASAEVEDDAPPPSGQFDLRPDVLLQRLSQNEKDLLLRQFLSTPGQLGVLMGQPSNNHNHKTPEDDLSHLSPQEAAMLDVQTGILMSLKEAKKPRPKPRPESVDEDVMEFGKRASREHFKEVCRKEDQEKELERTLLQKAMLESMNYGPRSATPMKTSEDDERLLMEQVKRESMADRDVSQVEADDDCLVEEVKRESTAPSASSSMSVEEERMVEEAMRESLSMPHPVSKEETLIEEVKRTSMLPNLAMLPFAAARQVPDVLHINRANRKSASSEVTSPFPEDIFADDVMACAASPARMPSRETSGGSDRKSPPLMMRPEPDR